MFMRKMTHYILLIVLAGGVLVVDQWTKWLVRTQLALGQSWMPIEALHPYLAIVRWTNTGAAFGMFQQFQQSSMVFAALAIIVSGIIIYYYRNSNNASWLVRIALGLQLGGAIGNLADRLTQSWTVTDFIWFAFFPAVFNVADAAISVGVALLMVDLLVEHWRNKAAASSAEPSAETAAPGAPVGPPAQQP
jgi:signal peptidase II